MKYIFNIIILFFLLNSGLIAQSSNTQNKFLYTLAMLPNWQSGQDEFIQIQRTTEQIIKENRIIEGTLKAQIEIKVISIQAEYYVLEWTYRNVEFHSPLPEQETLFSPKFGITEGLNIRFHLDKRGYFRKIENWQDIQKLAYQKIESFNPKGLSESKIQNLRNQYKAIYATQNQIETVFSKDILLYYGVYGQVYKLGKEKKKEVKLSNPLGGKDFPATISIELKNLNLTEQEGKVEVLQITKPETNREILYQYFQNVAKNQGKTPPEKDKIPLIELQDKSVFDINTTSHTVHKVERTRTLKSSNFQKIETTKIGFIEGN